MKKHFAYLLILIALFSIMTFYNNRNAYLLNEPLFKTSIKLEDVDDESTSNGVIIPKENLALSNIFHIKMKNNNIQNILGKFNVFSESHLNLDFTQEYILITDSSGEIKDSIYWREVDSSIKNIISDTEGNIYIQGVKYDKYDTWILEEYIYKYNPKTKKNLKIVDYVYSEDKPYIGSNIRDMQATKDGIVYYYYSQKEQTLSQYKYKLVQEMAFDLKVPDNTVLINIFGYEPGAIFFTTRENKVGLINTDLELEVTNNYLDEGIAIEDTFVKNEINYVLLENGKLDGYEVKNDTVVFGRVSSIRSKTDSFIDELGIELIGMSKLTYSGTLIYKRIVHYILVGLTIGLLVYILRFAYIYVFQQKIWMNLKLLFVLVPAISITVFIFTLYIMINQFAEVNDDIKDGKHIEFDRLINYQLEKIEKDYSQTYLTDYLENINPYEEFDTKGYITFENALSFENLIKKPGILEANDLEDLEAMYLVVDVVKEKRSYKIVDSENNYRWFAKRGIDNSYINEAISGKTVHGSTTDYIFTLKPVLNLENEVIGIVQVGMNYSGYKNENDENLLSEISKSVVIITSILLPLIILITYLLLKPIGRFTKDVKAINDENLDMHIEMNTHDEIEDLSDAFNNMTSNMNAYINDIKKMSESYHRFVPQEIFELLSKEKVEDIQLGNNIQMNMTILCAGINNFYEMTEKLGHEESFNLINNHLKIIGPIIRKHGGVIDRYLDIGVVAMFPESSDQAVEAAIEIQHTIEKLKEIREESYKTIDIAIHRGDVLIGIIGEAKRLQSSIVSDIVNMCLLLQAKATLLSSRILISKEAYESLDGEYKDRRLGSIKAMGRENAIDVIDIFEGDSKLEYGLKEQSSTVFTQAVSEFVNGDYEEARSNFVRVLEKNINDSVARLYFYEVDKKMNQEDVGQLEDHQLII